MHGALAVGGNLAVSGTSSLGTIDQIICSTNAGPPTVGTRSAGAKLALYTNTTPSSTDYAIGIEPSNMFLRLPMLQMVLNSMVTPPTAPQFQAMEI